VLGLAPVETFWGFLVAAIGLAATAGWTAWSLYGLRDRGAVPAEVPSQA
jgi:hypothetical protein